MDHQTRRQHPHRLQRLQVREDRPPRQDRPLRQRPRRGGACAVALLLTLGLAACTPAQDRVDLPVTDPDPVSSSDDVRGEGDGSLPGGSLPDGSLPDGGLVSIDDVHLAAIANLDPELRAAVQAAVADAEADGIEMVVTSGWRSAELQQRLLDAATEKYGSLDEARRWVSTPELSSHVTGDAVDIGYTDADSWLSQHGDDYGLCQTYTNEMWHFELATEPDGTCPEQKTDATG